MKEIQYNKTKCHEFNDKIELELFSFFKELNKEFGSAYMSYTFDYKNKKRYSFRTDGVWSSIYHKETINGRPIIEQCPLDIISRSKENKIIVWDDFSHKAQPKTFREIMGLRDDLGLRHGITLSTYFGEHHDAVALATEDKSNDLALRLISENGKNILCNLLLSCRKKIMSEIGD